MSFSPSDCEVSGKSERPDCEDSQELERDLEYEIDRGGDVPADPMDWPDVNDMRELERDFESIDGLLERARPRSFISSSAKSLSAMLGSYDCQCQPSPEFSLRFS